MPKRARFCASLNSLISAFPPSQAYGGRVAFGLSSFAGLWRTGSLAFFSPRRPPEVAFGDLKRNKVQQPAWILGLMGFSKCNINRNKPQQVQQVQHFGWDYPRSSEAMAGRRDFLSPRPRRKWRLTGYTVTTQCFRAFLNFSTGYKTRFVTGDDSHLDQCLQGL